MIQTADELASAPVILQWCQNSALSHLVRHEAWTIPLIEIAHIVGVVLVFGGVLVTNLRLLGWMFASETSSTLVADLERTIRVGLILLVVSGPLLFFAMPVKLFATLEFPVKLVLVAIAAAYYFGVHRKTIRTPEPSATIRRSAGISLALWIIAIAAGLEVGSFS
jgi:hypothetical protein